ncbi:MAG TPA: dockerin type I domain-containing protein [Candidatus Dormibacteraeota bacterium]|nr:dockerin type I domain-containing protein [Candidatus Dormibacteraeota bacterium]
MASSMKKAVFLIAILALGFVLAHFGVKQVQASTTNPTLFTLSALFAGWNSTSPSGTLTPCSPSGQATCNPTIIEFRGVPFRATIKWGGTGESMHTFAIYTSDITSDNVSNTDTCIASAKSGCLAASHTVTSISPTATLSFTPQIPVDGPPFLGLGVYQFYCQFHPQTMHGVFQIYKNPDPTNAGRVVIGDLATIAFYFNQNTTSTNAVADLNNDGKVNINDLAFDAFYWNDTI